MNEPLDKPICLTLVATITESAFIRPIDMHFISVIIIRTNGLLVTAVRFREKSICNNSKLSVIEENVYVLML